MTVESESELSVAEGQEDCVVTEETEGYIRSHCPEGAAAGVAERVDSRLDDVLDGRRDRRWPFFLNDPVDTDPTFSLG